MLGFLFHTVTTGSVTTGWVLFELILD